MAFNLSLGSISSNRSSTPSIGSGVTITYGRVVDVILDENHPEYKNRGGGINEVNNTIFFSQLFGIFARKPCKNGRGQHKKYHA